MAMPPHTSANLSDFPGFIDNIDPRDVPDGAAELQVNACSIIMGELTIRRGLQEVTFEPTT